MLHIDIEKTRREMAKRNLDVLIAASVVNVFYCTGHYSSLQLIATDQVRLAVIPRNSEPFVTSPAFEAEYFAKSGIFKVFEYPEEVYFKYPLAEDLYLRAKDNIKDIPELKGLSVSQTIMKSPILIAAKILKGRGLGGAKIGIDKEYIRTLIFEEVAKALPNCEIEDGTQIFLDLRAIKSDEEITNMVEAIKITEEALEACMPLIKEGGGVQNIRQKYFEAISKKPGAELGGGMVVGGLPPGQTLPPEKDRLMAGQVLKFDGGASFNHYGSDIGRSWAIGDIPKEQRNLYNMIVEAADAMVEKLRPGTKISDVYKVGNEIMRKVDTNYGRRVFMGHSHGIEVHERPYISPTTPETLKPGMVMCVEVPYYVLGGNSFQLEDEYLITEDGYKRLSERLPRKLL